MAVFVKEASVRTDLEKSLNLHNILEKSLKTSYTLKYLENWSKVLEKYLNLIKKSLKNDVWQFSFCYVGHFPFFLSEPYAEMPTTTIYA